MFEEHKLMKFFNNEQNITVFRDNEENILVQLGSSLEDSNWSNDWQKVQYNTDLLNPRHKYLYRMGGVN